MSASSIPEVLSGLGNRLAIETDDDAAHRLIAVSDVEEHLGHVNGKTQQPSTVRASLIECVHGW